MDQARGIGGRCYVVRSLVATVPGVEGGECSAVPVAGHTHALGLKVLQGEANVQDATPYRPGKNGFCKQHNTKGSGPADNIYFFYQRLWPGQIANTKSSLTLALGLMHLNFYLFYWPLLKNIFSQQVLDSNLSDNDGGLVDNEDDQEKEDSPMITDNDFDFLSNFLFTMSVCLTSTHLEHSISFRSVSAL